MHACEVLLPGRLRLLMHAISSLSFSFFYSYSYSFLVLIFILVLILILTLIRILSCYLDIFFAFSFPLLYLSFFSFFLLLIFPSFSSKEEAAKDESAFGFW